jgi:hypothetical protein
VIQILYTREVLENKIIMKGAWFFILRKKKKNDGVFFILFL